MTNRDGDGLQQSCLLSIGSQFPQLCKCGRDKDTVAMCSGGSKVQCMDVHDSFAYDFQRWVAIYCSLFPLCLYRCMLCKSLYVWQVCIYKTNRGGPDVGLPLIRLRIRCVNLHLHTPQYMYLHLR